MFLNESNVVRAFVIMNIEISNVVYCRHNADIVFIQYRYYTDNIDI